MNYNVRFPSPDGDKSRQVGARRFTLWNSTSSRKDGVHGDFHSPTPYFYAKTHLLGGVYAEAKVDMEYYSTYGTPGWRPGGYYEGYFEYPLGPISLSSPSQEGLGLITELKSAATRGLLSAVQRELVDFDLLTEVAEVGKTISFWRELTTRLSEFVFYVWTRQPLRALKAIGIHSPRPRDQRWTMRRINHWASQRGSVEDACSDIWLKYRYAMMPTLYSGNEVLKLLAGFKDDVIPTRSQASFPGRKYYLDPGYNVWHDASGGGFCYSVKRENVFTGSVRAYGYWTGLKGAVDSIRGTRLLDYAQTLWEVVPFSFLVDWMWNLSTYMDNCRTDAKVKWHRGAFTYKLIWVESLAGSFMFYQNSATSRYSGGFTSQPNYSAKRKTFYFKREPWENSPLEFLNLPSFDPSFNARRLLDSAALSLAALKGRLKYRWVHQLS